MFLVCFCTLGFFWGEAEHEASLLIHRYRHKGSDLTETMKSMGESGCIVSMSLNTAVSVWTLHNSRDTGRINEINLSSLLQLYISGISILHSQWGCFVLKMPSKYIFLRNGPVCQPRRWERQMRNMPVGLLGVRCWNRWDPDGSSSNPFIIGDRELWSICKNDVEEWFILSIWR